MSEPLLRPDPGSVPGDVGGPLVADRACDVDGCDNVAEDVLAADQRLLVPGTGVIAVRCWFFLCADHRSVVASSLDSSSEAWRAEFGRQALTLAEGG